MGARQAPGGGGLATGRFIVLGVVKPLTMGGPSSSSLWFALGIIGVGALTVLGSLSLGQGPAGLRQGGEPRMIGPANERGSNMSGDTSGLATVLVGSGASAMAYDAGNGLVYVVDTNCTGTPCGKGAVSVISGAVLVATIPVPIDPDSVIYDPANGDVYVGSTDCDSYPCGSSVLSVISGTSVIATVQVPPVSAVIGFDPGNDDVLVGNATGCAPRECLSGNLTFVSGTSVVAMVPTGGAPGPVAYDDATGLLYVSVNTDIYISDGILVFSGTQVVATVPVGGCPGDLVYDAVNGYVYDAGLPACGDLVMPSQGNLTVISGSTVAAHVPVGIDSIVAALDPDNGNVYAANFGSGSVSVVHGTSLVASVPVGKYPQSVVPDIANGLVYVTNDGSNNVSIISGIKIAATVPIDYYPGTEVYDSGNGDMYVQSQCQFAVCRNDNVTLIGQLVVSLIVSPSTIPIGGTAYVNISAIGGAPPYTYAYSDLPPGCVSWNVSSLSCTPTQAGEFSGIAGRATDSQGLSVVSANLTLIVTPPPRSGSAPGFIFMVVSLGVVDMLMVALVILAVIVVAFLFSRRKRREKRGGDRGPSLPKPTEAVSRKEPPAQGVSPATPPAAPPDLPK
jgi:YVTN family beta-propeller protein